MPSSYTLGKYFEAFLQSQLASGRYNNASEVLRDGLRLLEDRERRLAGLIRELEGGIADLEAGRFQETNAMFDELEARYAAMAVSKTLA